MPLAVYEMNDRKNGSLNDRPNDQLPDGLLAQLVRALHRYRRGYRVRIPYRPDLFSDFLFRTAKVLSITTMIFFLSKNPYVALSVKKSIYNYMAGV